MLNTQNEIAELKVTASDQFPSWLRTVGASLAFTTYQAGKLFMMGSKPDGSLSTFERTIERCMGLAARGGSLFVSSLYQIWRFENVMDEGETRGGFDACYSPQMSFVTGDIDIHDMALDANDDLTFINTKFGCLAQPSLDASFVPVWRPPFVSNLAAEDRCHLNGLAMGPHGPEYVTAVSTSDVVDGWREQRCDGGVVVHIPTGEIVSHGLSMPHSPRLRDGVLYLLNSGKGEFGVVDPASGDFKPIAFCPGYARGLAFVDDFAVIGLSLPRGSKTFQGLPLDAALANRQTEARCGLMVVDLKTGETAHWVRIEGVVSELYDIAVLPGILRPSIIGFQSDEIRRTIKIASSKSVERKRVATQIGE